MNALLTILIVFVGTGVLVLVARGAFGPTGSSGWWLVRKLKRRMKRQRRQANRKAKRAWWHGRQRGRNEKRRRP